MTTKIPRPTVKAHYYVYVQPCPTHVVHRLKKRLKDWGQIGIRRCRRGQSHVVIGPYTSIDGAQQITRALRPHHACEVVPEKMRPIAQSRFLPCQHRACGVQRATLRQGTQSKRSCRPCVRSPAVLPSVLTKPVAGKVVVGKPVTGKAGARSSAICQSVAGTSVAGKQAARRPMARQKAFQQRAQRHP